MTDRETRRQTFHMLFGGALIGVALLLGPAITPWFFGASFLVGLLILHLKLSGAKVPLVDDVIRSFERKTALFPGQGALMFFAGAFFAFTYTPYPFALSVIAMIGFGDGFSTLVGRAGRHKLPWNPKKTFEGLAAFFLSAAAMASFTVSVTAALFYGGILALVETVPWEWDDNLALAIAAVVLYHLVGLTAFH